ncbi:hypothetical protein IWX50DRAFT_612878 [Phyllosticta citricarpa]
MASSGCLSKGPTASNLGEGSWEHADHIDERQTGLIVEDTKHSRPGEVPDLTFDVCCLHLDSHLKSTGASRYLCRGASVNAIWSPSLGKLRRSKSLASACLAPQPTTTTTSTSTICTQPFCCTSPRPQSHLPLVCIVLRPQSTRLFRPTLRSNWRRKERPPKVVADVVRNNDGPSSRADPETLFRYIPSENEVTSLRNTRPLDSSTTGSSIVASGQTFADIARSGAPRPQNDDLHRQRSSSGLMRMRPKQRNWKPLDLSGIDIYAERSPLAGMSDYSTPFESDSLGNSFAPDSAISKETSGCFGEVLSRDPSMPSMAQPEPHIQTMAYAENSHATFPQNQDLDEILQTFGQRLPDPVWLRANEGKSSGQVKFIQHPSRDVTAHRWSAQNFEWQEIGRYSCNRKFMDGDVISPLFLQHVEADPSRPQSLKYFAKLANDYSGYIQSRPPSLDSTPLTYAPRPNLNLNPSLHDPARYDSLSSVATSHNALELPSLTHLSLADRPAVVQASRTLRTNSMNMHLQGLGAAEDDPFTESISPRNTRAFVPSPDTLRSTTAVQDANMMDFGFRFPPPGISIRQRDDSIYDASDRDDTSVISNDRRAFFANQERKRTEQMRQSVLNPGPQTNSGNLTMGNFQRMQPQRMSYTQIREAMIYEEMRSREPVTAVFAPADYQAPVILQRGGGDAQHSQTDESRARMREYLNRTANELPSRSTSYLTPMDSINSDSTEPMSRSFEHPTSHSLIPRDVVRPNSSISQASRGGMLRSSDPDFDQAQSTALVFNAINTELTPQNFDGPFFENTEPSPNNPNVHRTIHKSHEEEFEEWWTSGSTYQRQKDYVDSVNAAGTGHGSSAVTNQLLVSLYERLRSYVREPGAKPKPGDYFAPFGKPPDWCIDRGRGGKHSFFGEDYGEVPKRIGRDPRFKPTFGQFATPYNTDHGALNWAGAEEESFSFNANPGGVTSLGARIGQAGSHFRH